MAAPPPSSCETPDHPSWMWRYNRNKKLVWFQPWYTRAEQWPPRYRNMGMPHGFPFLEEPETASESTGTAKSDSEKSHPQARFALNYAHDLNHLRKVGTGNGVLGNPPGPAPPRLFVMHGNQKVLPPVSDPVKHSTPITDGGSKKSLLDEMMLGGSFDPLDPPHYLEATLDQAVSYPGTFPHKVRALKQSVKRPYRVCPGSSHCGVSRSDLLNAWRKKHYGDLRGHLESDRERCIREAMNFGNKDMPNRIDDHGDANFRPAGCVGVDKCPTAKIRVY